mgnify:CR=1 FL=1
MLSLLLSVSLVASTLNATAPVAREAPPAVSGQEIAGVQAYTGADGKNADYIPILATVPMSSRSSPPPTSKPRSIITG